MKIKQKRLFYLLIFFGILAIFLSVSCSKKNDMSPAESWVRVYDHSDFNRLFYALDVKELADNSFIILGSTKMDTTIWPVPYILSTNNEGNMQWTSQSDAFSSPVPDIISTSGSLYFFCMDNTLGTNVLKINTDGSGPTLFKTLPDLTYPLSASQTTDNKILLTSYDRITRSTVLTCFDSNFSIIWSKEYPGIENYEEKVRLHLTRQGAYFPFFTGELKAGSKAYYFVNGFYNFIFSLMFINPANGDMSGVVNGIPYSAAASALIQRNDTSFILTRYDENQNYINVKPDISFTTASNITAMGGTSWPEIDKNAVIKTLKTTINNKDILIISTITRSKQILLLFFDPLTGVLKTSKYFGSDNPVDLASVIPTSEGGLAVLTQTYVAGRFSRIQLFKIPPSKLKF